MTTIHDVEPIELIEQVAEELKKIEEIKPPVWASYVKTGRHKERPPINADWWHTRAASVLRKVYKLGPIGVSKLRRYYGGKPNRGVKMEHFYKGSGNIIRKVLQQLEKAGFLKNETKSRRKGRVITPKGKSFLDKIAAKIAKGRVTQKKEKPKIEKSAEKGEKPIRKEPIREKPIKEKIEKKEELKKPEEPKSKKEPKKEDKKTK